MGKEQPSVIVTIILKWQSQYFSDAFNYKSFPGGSVVKNPPGSGRSPGEGNGNPLQYSCLENSMDRGDSQATDHGVTKESDMTEWPTLLS